MLSLILKIVGSLFGIIAAWYISRVIRGWVQYVYTEYEKGKSERQDLELSKEKLALDEIQKRNKVRIDDLLGGNNENSDKGSSTPPANT